MDIFTPVKQALRNLSIRKRKEVAEKAGVKPRLVASILTGETKDPGVLKIQKLYKALENEQLPTLQRRTNPPQV